MLYLPGPYTLATTLRTLQGHSSGCALAAPPLSALETDQVIFAPLPLSLVSFVLSLVQVRESQRPLSPAIRHRQWVNGQEATGKKREAVVYTLLLRIAH